MGFTVGAHACFPEKGINSLEFATSYMSKLDLGADQDKDLFLNIGKISGGTAVNAVPEKIMIEGEVRSFSKEKFDNAIEFLQTKLEHTHQNYLDASYTFNSSGYCGGYTHDEESTPVQFVENILQLQKIPIKKKRVFGISDANSFAELGLSVVTISDGVVDPHTTSERISVQDIEKLKSIISHMLRSAHQF